MNVISWAILGLIVGVLAKVIMPGKDPGGFVVTILLGIGGAFVGGFVARAAGIGDFTGFNAGSILIATGGAVLLLFLYRLIRK